MAGEGGSVTLYATMNEEQLRAELAKRDDDFANASDSRDRWKHRAQSLDEERDAFRDLVVGFAEDVERMIGPISVDESVEVHAIRTRAADIKGELS